MGLRDQAATDLQAIVEDDAGGFGWPITIINPEGIEAELVGLATDVSRAIDPQTGQAVSGRVASVALSLARLELCEGLGVPSGTSDQTVKPWRITFKDTNGNEHRFKISEANPDRAIGLVTCLLEFYDWGP